MPYFQLIAVFISVFLVMVGVVSYIPYLMTLWRGHSETILDRSARELSRFFIDIEPKRIIASAVVLGGVLGWMSGSWVFAVATVVAGLFAPKIILQLWKSWRTSQFESQLMDALLLMNNAMKSGLDLAAGFELIATNMKAPISEEFGLVLNSYRLGAPLDHALLELADRIRSRTLDTVISAIIIQRDTGGNLVKTFEQLVVTIREESKLQQKVKAMTSQGRTQVFVLSIFPWIIAVAFYLVSPDLMKPALANPYGQITLVGLIVWEIIGMFVTKKMVTVDV